MGITPGMMPIFKTGVFSHSGAQPTEGYGKSMDFGLIFARFRGLDAMRCNICENEQSRSPVTVHLHKHLDPCSGIHWLDICRLDLSVFPISAPWVEVLGLSVQLCCLWQRNRNISMI